MIADTLEVRSAFDVLMQCRMLPMLLESFVGVFSLYSFRRKDVNYMLEDMRRNQHLITNDVMRYMAQYDVRCPSLSIVVKKFRLSQASGDPDVIGQLVLRLADWYFAWAPGGE